MVSRADGVLFRVWSRKVRVEKEQREAHALPDRRESYGRKKGNRWGQWSDQQTTLMRVLCTSVRAALGTQTRETWELDLPGGDGFFFFLRRSPFGVESEPVPKKLFRLVLGAGSSRRRSNTGSARLGGSGLQV